MESLGWDLVQATQFVSYSNAAQVPGLALSGRAIKAFGGSAGAFVSALAAVAQHVLEAVWVKSPAQQFSLLPLFALRGLGKPGVEVMLMQAGEEAGMGRAELR